MAISAERALRQAMTKRDARLDELASEFVGAKVTTEYNLLLGTMGRHVTSRTDGKRLTATQKAHIQGLWDGYGALEGLIRYFNQPGMSKKRSRRG